MTGQNILPNVESDNNIPIPDGFELDFRKHVQLVINQKIRDGTLDEQCVITGVLTKNIIRSNNDIVPIDFIDEENRPVGTVNINGWKVV